MTLKLVSKALALTAFSGLLGHAAAADLPPATAKPLSDILASVQLEVSKAEFDDGLWEIKGCTASACEKLYIDPHTGQIKRRKNLSRVDRPAPQTGPSAHELVNRIEAANIGTITEIDFDNGAWKIELSKALSPV